jgi:hypothetical protein
MNLGEFFFVKKKSEEKSQYILVKCVASETKMFSTIYFYRIFDIEKIALLGGLKRFDPDEMDCSPYGTTPKEWEYLEEYWERYL